MGLRWTRRRRREGLLVAVVAACLVVGSPGFVAPHAALPSRARGGRSIKSLGWAREQHRGVCMSAAEELGGGGLGEELEGEGAASWLNPMPVNPNPSMEERRRRLMRSVLQGVVSFAAFTFGAPAAQQAARNHLGVDNFVTRSAAAEASIVKKFSKRTLGEKLSNVPVFMVVNHEGAPYLTPSPDGSQLGVIFTNLEDANSQCQEMLQLQFYEDDARLLVISLDKAFQMVKEGPRATGGTNEKGMQEVMTFKLNEDDGTREKAARMGVSRTQLDEVDIPVFYAEGLIVKKSRDNVKALFLDMEDLAKAWNKARKADPNMPRKPKIKVFDLVEVILQMEESDDYKSFGFFPSSKSVDYVKAARDVKGHRTRLTRMREF